MPDGLSSHSMNKKYKARIDRVLQYIESHLSRNISLSDVAAVSCFSEFHFHRVFTAIMGETVNDYIVRRKLERAVNMLIFKTEWSVTQVALENGFSSTANFSKAVKLYFGFSPSEIRNPSKIKNSKIGKISSKYGKEFNPSDLYPTHITHEVMNTANREDINMNVEVRALSGLRVGTLASERGYEPDSIYAAWDKLIDWAVHNGIQVSEQQRFALAFDNPTVTPIEKCRYTAAIVIGDEVSVQSPFTVAEIPEGKYAVLYFKGAPEEALNAQLSLYSDWFPSSGFELDNFPMLEHYLNDAREDGYVEMEIYVKLKAI